MKNKKVKKAMILLLVLAVLGGAAVGGVYAYQKYQRDNLQAEVELVSNLSWGFWGDEMTSQGLVTDSSAQEIHIEDKVVAEVKVSEGDTVSIGDPLLVYDTTETGLQLEMKQLALQGIQNDITLAQREIDRLKKIKPVSTTTPSAVAKPNNSTANSSTTQKKKPASVVMIQVQKKDGKAYNYIDKTAKPYEGKGTPEKPYRFLCTPECYVLGSYLNRLATKEQVAAFEIWSGNSTTEGTLISCWTVDGSEQTTVDADSRWMVSTHEELEDEYTIEEETEEESEEPESETTSTEETETYTQEELNKEIAEKESELKELNVSKKKAELEMDSLKKSQDSATVLATINGVVKTVGDPENPPVDGSPFLEVSGSQGIYVKGEISELKKDQIEIGQIISANSWNTGQTYSAEITQIADYPSDNNMGYYGEGNPNVSYYSFMAYIEDAEGLTNGDYLDLTITSSNTEEETNSLYIAKAYVREENGQSYVLKVGEDERLVKQYVKTGKTIYGSAIEIKAGINESDRLAFPYGKTAKEGIKAVKAGEIN